MHAKTFEPKLVSLLKEGLTLRMFFRDALAGIIVGIVAFPLAIAFAIASGVKPEQGLITAVIAGFLISLFSGSRVQIGGPTGAFIVIVFGIVQKYGYEGLALATIMAGILLIIMGLARLGDAIKFIPYPVTVGFTSGIAVIIFVTQVRDLFGLNIAGLPNHFLEKCLSYFTHLSSFNLHAFGLGILTILIIVMWRKITDKLPGPLIAIIVTTLIVKLFHLPVETIGLRFGVVPNHIPMPRIPEIHLKTILSLTSPAITIALLAGIESLLSAVVADGMTGRRHRSNMELVAQGIANIASPLFGGIPATGAIARTATNIKNGGKTPISGIIHAVTVCILFVFLGPLASLIPMATLAGILVVVAYNMSEWHLFMKILRTSKSDVFILLATFLLTILVDLTVAIEVGVVLSALLFVRRMTEVTQVNVLNGSLSDEENPEDQKAFGEENIPPGVEIYEITGPFFFGAVDTFKNALGQLKRHPKVLIILMRHVPVMDASGLNALEDALRTFHRGKVKIILCGVQSQPLSVIKNSAIVKFLPEDQIIPELSEALNKAKQLIFL